MADFWTRYRRNRAAVLGLGILLTILIMAATAHLFYPEDPFRLVGRPLSGPPVSYTHLTLPTNREV